MSYSRRTFFKRAASFAVSLVALPRLLKAEATPVPFADCLNGGYFRIAYGSIRVWRKP